MDHEIDLQKYIRALAARWHWIMFVGLLAGIIAGVYTLLQPRMYVATAAVLLQGTRSNVTFDPRFVTNEEIDPDRRRQGLIALAASDIIEGEVRSTLGAKEGEIGTLAKRI